MRRAEVRDKMCYQVLGDDIVINHNEVASKYIELMNDLGVEISAPKTHKSYNMYEFAKRWYRSGNEISGIPVKAFETVAPF
jgi:hypothetical protein